jgi:hypothetical protein
LLDEPALRAGAAAAGRARAESEYGYDVLAARLVDALDRAAQGAP